MGGCDLAIDGPGFSPNVDANTILLYGKVSDVNIKFPAPAQTGKWNSD